MYQAFWSLAHKISARLNFTKIGGAVQKRNHYGQIEFQFYDPQQSLRCWSWVKNQLLMSVSKKKQILLASPRKKTRQLLIQPCGRQFYYLIILWTAFQQQRLSGFLKRKVQFRAIFSNWFHFRRIKSDTPGYKENLTKNNIQKKLS